ncbi:MAG: glycosyltransferase, partial [Phaeodactylibacter sp.]|nr:glycosyltransferase [Phaeodactylibacter sp.]
SISWSIGLLLTAAYFAWMFYFQRGWMQIPIFEASNTVFTVDPPFVSILVPIRNEARQIEQCLKSLQDQRYPASALEILVLDDHSTDTGPAIVQHFPLASIRYVNLAEQSAFADLQHKKRALSIGVQWARGDYILTTDGDCRVPPDWVATMVGFLRKKDLVGVTGPVLLEGDPNAFEQFQVLDLMGMMQITAAGSHYGSMHLANGANFAFRKDAFHAVGGYAAQAQFASGDDVFLMQQLAAQFPGRVAFLKSPSAIVRTGVEARLPDFVQQRLRWATKNRSTPELPMLVALTSVFFFSWALLLVLPAGILLPGLVPLAVLMWAVKLGLDRRMLGQMAAFFEARQAMRWFFPASVLHVLYISGIGLLANLKKRYRWKDRQVR